LRTLIVATQIRLPGSHGGSTHVGELISHLGQYGPVLALGRRGSTQSGVLGVGLALRMPRWLRPLAVRIELQTALRAARAFRPDVIYERASSYGLGALLSQRLGVPMLCMVLDEHYSWSSLKRAQFLVSTTAETIPESMRHKFVKVSWGANTQLFNADVAPVGEPALPAFDGFTVGYVGSFKRWHGLLDLVQAAAALHSRNVRFVLVGDGPERARVERAVQAAALSERFVFAGAVNYDAVPGWIAACDACVAPFRPEGHNASAGEFILDPLKVFEYLAMAKPTVTVSSANLRALFQQREHLLMVQPADIAGLCSALEELMNDPVAGRAMAERGKQVVLAKHTWAAHAAHLHDLFQQMTPSARFS
jgi:glycosyltransferase involved in cell wall biosynthesis